LISFEKLFSVLDKKSSELEQTDYGHPKAPVIDQISMV